MAGNVTVHKYEKQAVDARGYPVPVGQEPAIVTQTNVSDGTSDPYPAFNALTTFIMVKTDAKVSLRFGNSSGSTPVAVKWGNAGALPMAADETLYFGVFGGQILAIIDDV